MTRRWHELEARRLMRLERSARRAHRPPADTPIQPHARLSRAQCRFSCGRHRNRNPALRHELHVPGMILMLVRHDDAARPSFVDEATYGLARSRKASVDELIANEEHEYRVSQRGTAPGPQSNEVHVVTHLVGSRTGDRDPSCEFSVGQLASLPVNPRFGSTGNLRN